jgi:hypothetical protein
MGGLTMSIFRFVKTFVLFLCLFGFAATAWSSEVDKTKKDAAGAIGEEAVITKVDHDKITCQSLSDKSKEVVVSMANAEDLKVGDRVLLQGNSLKKLDAATPDSTQQPMPSTKDLEKPAAPKP